MSRPRPIELTPEEAEAHASAQRQYAWAEGRADARRGLALRLDRFQRTELQDLYASGHREGSP